jgi:diguanylate cyclase (GGDEF)-like protein
VRFRTSHAANGRRIQKSLGQLKRSGVNPLLLGEVEAHFVELNRLAEDLDKVINRARVDSNSAQDVLVAISDRASEINAAVDRVLGAVSNDVDRRGKTIQQEVGAIVSMVVAFSVTAVILLVLAGYALRAYIGESTVRKQLALFPECNPHPILTVSTNGEPIYANRGALKMLVECGLQPRDLPRLLPGDLASRLVTLRGSGLATDRFEYHTCGRDLSCEIHPLPDDNLFYLYLSDITEHKRAEERLVQQAYHDALTGLPNRYKLQEALTEAMNAATSGALLFLSVDRFRMFVDSFGHNIGDEVLQAVADQITQMLRGQCSEFHSARLFRMDGARFAVFVPGVGSVSTLDALAKLIQGCTVKPVWVSNHELLITFSIGGSLFPRDGTDAGTVVREADRALQSVRDQGGNGFRRYGSDLDAECLELLELETALRLAHERGELALHYQPQVNIKTGAIVGFEALMRWRHAELGEISPQRFVPLAEDTGLIVPIGEWVLHTACVQARAWSDSGLRDFAVGVNISARQFATGDLPRTVRRVVQDTGLDPRCLDLEITESVAIQDAERTVETLTAFKDIGVRLSIDDFGTGYSSLSYLKRFPVDRLKIDQSFVRNVASDPSDAAIIRAVIALARNLGLSVIAEGVETESQRALLTRFGCKEMQGYLVARPCPAPDLEPFIASRQNSRLLNAATPVVRKLRIV